MLCAGSQAAAADTPRTGYRSVFVLVCPVGQKPIRRHDLPAPIEHSVASGRRWRGLMLECLGVPSLRCEGKTIIESTCTLSNSFRLHPLELLREENDALKDCDYHGDTTRRRRASYLQWRWACNSTYSCMSSPPVINVPKDLGPTYANRVGTSRYPPPSRCRPRNSASERGPQHSTVHATSPLLAVMIWTARAKLDDAGTATADSRGV
jgi:hypothetical protein